LHTYTHTFKQSHKILIVFTKTTKYFTMTSSNSNMDSFASLAGGIPDLSLLLSPSLNASNTLPNTAPPSQVNTIQDVAAPPVAGSFLLGIHSYKSLEGVDLPEFVKEHNATLTFPEKLMLMLTYVEKLAKDNGSDPLMAWTPDGRAFVIHKKDALVSEVLPLFFKQGKFASFTRKLYRWGFRQVSISLERVQRKEMIFGHEYFQRDNKELMAKMRSVTAAGRKRAAKRTQDDVKGFTDPFENEELQLPNFSQIQQLQPDPIPSIPDGTFGGKRLSSNDMDLLNGLIPQSNKRLKLSDSSSGGSQRLLPLSSLGNNGPLLQNSSASQQLTNNYLSMLSQANNLNNNNGASMNLNNNSLLIQQAQQNLQNALQQQSLQSARLQQTLVGDNARHQAANTLDFLMQLQK